jgi:purine-binding chemotaxis protein CheW
MPAYVLFETASQTFALPAADVRQVLRMAAPARVPGAPAALRGLLNVHGSLVPVLDLRARLGLPPRPLDPESHLLLASTGGRLVALEVDRVVEVREVADGAAASEVAASLGSDLVAGAVTLPDGVVVIQALERLATVAEPAPGTASP